MLLSGSKLLPIARCTDSIAGLRSASVWFGFRSGASPPPFVLVTLKGIHSPNAIACVKIAWERGSSSGGEGIGRGVGGGRWGWSFCEGRVLGWGVVNGEKSIRVVIWGRVKGFSGII